MKLGYKLFDLVVTLVAGALLYGLKKFGELVFAWLR